MHIDDTIYKNNKTNDETKSFKAIKTFGYNGTAVFEILHDLDLDILITYDLNIPILVKKRLGLF